MEQQDYKRKFRKKGKKLILIPLAIAAFLALVSFVVMLLWNHLLPGIINVSTITFWQAMGIFILCKILFGFGKGGGPWMRDKMRGRMEERFKDMNPEERLKFKEEMGNRCGWRKRAYNEPDTYNSTRPSAADETAD